MNRKAVKDAAVSMRETLERQYFCLIFCPVKGKGVVYTECIVNEDIQIREKEMKDRE